MTFAPQKKKWHWNRIIIITLLTLFLARFVVVDVVAWFNTYLKDRKSSFDKESNPSKTFRGNYFNPLESVLHLGLFEDSPSQQTEQIFTANDDLPHEKPNISKTQFNVFLQKSLANILDPLPIPDIVNIDYTFKQCNVTGKAIYNKIYGLKNLEGDIDIHSDEIIITLKQRNMTVIGRLDVILSNCPMGSSSLPVNSDYDLFMGYTMFNMSVAVKIDPVSSFKLYGVDFDAKQIKFSLPDDVRSISLRMAMLPSMITSMGHEILEDMKPSLIKKLTIVFHKHIQEFLDDLQKNNSKKNGMETKLR